MIRRPALVLVTDASLPLLCVRVLDARTRAELDPGHPDVLPAEIELRR